MWFEWLEMTLERTAAPQEFSGGRERLQRVAADVDGDAADETDGESAPVRTPADV
jgi:hypothetical protein